MTPPRTIPPQTPPPMDDVDSSRANMVPDLFVRGSGPPDGDLGVSWGQRPSYRPSADAQVEALGRQSGRNMAHSPQTLFFSSTFASEGDRATGEQPSSCHQQRSHSRSMNSLPNKGYNGHSVSPPNPYKGKRDMRKTPRLRWTPVGTHRVFVAHWHWMWTTDQKMRMTCPSGAL
jgi:hypothetical protein